MGAIERRDIQWTGNLDIPQLVRQINEWAGKVSNAITLNFRGSYPQVEVYHDAVSARGVWIALEAYEIESVTLRTDTSTATARLLLNGSPVTFTGAVTSLSVTTTVTTWEVESGGTVAADDYVELDLTALAGNNVWGAMKVRRIG